MRQLHAAKQRVPGSSMGGDPTSRVMMSLALETSDDKRMFRRHTCWKTAMIMRYCCVFVMEDWDELEKRSFCPKTWKFSVPNCIYVATIQIRRNRTLRTLPSQEHGASSRIASKLSTKSPSSRPSILVTLDISTTSTSASNQVGNHWHTEDNAFAHRRHCWNFDSKQMAGGMGDATDWIYFWTPQCRYKMIQNSLTKLPNTSSAAGWPNNSPSRSVTDSSWASRLALHLEHRIAMFQRWEFQIPKKPHCPEQDFNRHSPSPAIIVNHIES